MDPQAFGDTAEVAPGISAIDTKMVGKRLVTSAYLIAADEPALIETGPATSADAVHAGLARHGMGPDDLAHIIVTHIHLDHAGGVGTLVRRFPRASVWVHERGAPHLADPTKLVASTERVYGAERMLEFFGEVEPTPADRLRAVADGDSVLLGSRTLDVLHTPGHASHHVALADADTGVVFTGDALGVHIPDVGVLRPATPPPEFDVELAVQSIERIRGRARSSLMLSHFGPMDEIDDTCSLAAERILKWGEIVRAGLEATDDIDEIATMLEEQGERDYLQDAGRPIDLERYDVLSSIRMNAMGLIRYWRKRAERETAARTPDAQSS